MPRTLTIEKTYVASAKVEVPAELENEFVDGRATDKLRDWLAEQADEMQPSNSPDTGATIHWASTLVEDERGLEVADFG